MSRMRDKSGNTIRDDGIQFRETRVPVPVPLMEFDPGSMQDVARRVQKIKQLGRRGGEKKLFGGKLKKERIRVKLIERLMYIYTYIYIYKKIK